MGTCRLILALLFGFVASAAAEPTPALKSEPAPKASPAAPKFDPATRAVSTWRTEAADHLALAPARAEALRGSGAAPPVARCVKLNNYWCIKTAGWDGELAADGEGHVAFASAVEGAAVAALLLKRYCIDFERKTAMAIISHWAPAQCGLLAGGARPKLRAAKAIAPKGLANTLRGRWLASHARGFAPPLPGRGTKVRTSVVADHITRTLPAPTIAVGLGEASRPMTLDALMMSSPNAPPSRSMLGMPHAGAASLSACGSDSARIASYAAKAAEGIVPGAGGDLGLFTADGTPTPNLATMMANMARVEIGPDAAQTALIGAGIAAAFKPDRNAKDKPVEVPDASVKETGAK